MLGKLQNALQELYEVELGCSVEEFLITDPATATHYDQSPQPRDIQEKLLLRQLENELHLSLYIDGAVLDRLSANDPLEHLHNDNVSDFMLALEGVSHFVYVAWRASCDQCFSLLELELQAEIDKFVLTSHLLKIQSTNSLQDLHQCLFATPKFDDQLADHERQRYVDASRFAGKYCQHIQHRYLRSTSPAAYMSELRYFYRLPNLEKIAHINRLRS